MRIIKRIIFILIIVILLLNCSQNETSRSEFVLGTVCTITLYENGKQKVYKEIFDRLREIENRMSVNISGSDVDKINKNAGIAPVMVSDEVFALIERAVYFSQISNGAFDITVGPLVSLWDIDGDNPKVPLQEEIDNVLQLINWRNIDMDKPGKTVFLKKPGMAIDLGAIAKGYAADQTGEIIRKAGIPRAIIDLGGNILAIGVKKDKTPWKIGIQNPLDSRGEYIGIVQVPEKTIVTSGVYERFFKAKWDLESGKYILVNTNNDEGDLRHFHHLFSPVTGFPADNGLLSVTVVADISMDADALSTAIFIMGYDKGRKLIESLNGTAGIFVFDNKNVFVAGNVDFILTDND